MAAKLSSTTQAEISRMTKIIAGKIGYNPDEKNASYEQFAKEMGDYIADNIREFMQKGLEEQDALIATQQKLSGDGFNTSMNEFFNKYGGAKKMNKPAFTRNTARPGMKFVPPIIPMLYAAFALIGLGFGVMIGKIVGMVGIGIVCGLLIGFGLGMVTHAVMLLEEKR